MPALYGQNSQSGNPPPPAAGPEETLEEILEVIDRIEENQEGTVYHTSFEHAIRNSGEGAGATNFLQSFNESKYEETFFSRPADKINIPEVRNAKATFVYNYYTRDERIRPDDVSPSKRIVSLNSSTTDEIFYRLKNKKIARYVKLEFQPPQVDPNLIGRVSLNNTGTDLTNKLNKIIVEGGLSNSFFVGTEILDTGKESKIYSMLNGAMFFMEIPTAENSPKEAAEKLYNTLTEKGGLKGQDKKLALNALANIASEGYNMAPTDVSPEVASFASDPIGKQTFSVQFNQLLMSDLITNSSIIPDNVFQDELRSLENFSKTIKSNLLNTISENVYTEADYDLQVEAVSEVALDDNNNYLSENDLQNSLPDIKFAGYLIEKYEVMPNEEVRFVGRNYISNHDAMYSIDDSVRYGASYFYKIRTVCRVKMLASREDQIDPTLNQLVMATCYMASEGVLTTVNTVEKVPPPPVQVMRATFDFESLLPRLTWEFPLNKQRDIKRFQIFKRFNINQPFVLLKEYDFDNSEVRTAVNEIAPSSNVVRMRRAQLSFIDTTHKEGEKPIYCIACVDAHGLSSNLGIQVQVSRDRYTNKVTRTVMSKPGAPKPYPNLFINLDAFQDVIKASNYERAKVFLDPEYYRVTKKIKHGGGYVEEKDLNFLAIDRDNFRYSLHMINTDNQKDALVKIKLTNKTSLAAVDEDFFNVNVANFSENNINFQYGID